MVQGLPCAEHGESSSCRCLGGGPAYSAAATCSQGLVHTGSPHGRLSRVPSPSQATGGGRSARYPFGSSVACLPTQAAFLDKVGFVLSVFFYMPVSVSVHPGQRGGVSRLPCRPIPWPSQGLPHIGPLWASELVTTPSLTRSTWSHAIPPSRCHSRVGNLLPTVPGLWDSDYLAS